MIYDYRNEMGISGTVLGMFVLLWSSRVYFYLFCTLLFQFLADEIVFESDLATDIPDSNSIPWL